MEGLGIYHHNGWWETDVQ